MQFYLSNITIIFIQILSAPDIFISLSAVAGGRIDLPCDTASPVEGDEVYLVLWYKDESTTPIYSLDARKGRAAEARHAANENLAPRTFFSTMAKPSVLEVESLVVEDEGEYRCRVDFRKARTRHSTIYLQIIVPPGIPIIKDHNGGVLRGMIGPFNEGGKLLLICECEGGKPLPSLTWWKGTILLDDTYEVTSPKTVRNELEIPVLERHDLMAVFICQASNNNISVPTTSSITLDMNFRPMEVRIEGNRRSFSANKPLELVCITAGSRPPAMITWRKGSVKLKAEREKVTAGGSVTTSTLVFTPTSEDNGKFLYCQADNMAISGNTLEDVWKLDIHFIPQLNVRLGSKLRHSNIQERNDVYFECNIRANPWVTEIGWKFEDRELHTNITAGIIVSNQTLVLQRVQRENRGKYSCTATNSEDQGESNKVHLRVQFAPICKERQKTHYGAMLHTAVRIFCEVEADPSDVTFRWEFNNTASSTAIVPFRSAGTKSVVNHIPRTDNDFGMLYCWGKNMVGNQHHPCVYTVVPAGLPGAVKNCSINSETERSFLLHCLEGEDGGLAQRFYMEVREASSQKLRANVSSERPSFVARGLSSGTVFLVKVYASNAKGNSPAVFVRVGTLPAPESQTQRDDMWQLSISPVLLVLIAIMGGVVFVALSIVLYVKLRSRMQARKAASQTTVSCKSHSAPSPFFEEGCNVCAYREDQKLQGLMTGNGMVSNGGRIEKDGRLTYINSNSVGWKKFPTSKSKDSEIIDRSVIDLPKTGNDASVITPVSSQAGSASPTIDSQDDAASETPRSNSRHPSINSLTDDSGASSPLSSSRQTEV